MQSLPIRRMTSTIIRRHHFRLFSRPQSTTPASAISSWPSIQIQPQYNPSSQNSCTITPIRKFHISLPQKMSDEDYANFLSKSQKDYSKPSAKTSEPSKSGSGSSKGNKGVSGSKYSSIKNIGDDRRYVSEADEPFHEVEFDWEGSGIPDEKSFAELVGLDAQDVETLTTKQWDPKGDYEDVTKAVSEAGGGGGSSDNTVKVYKTAGSGARVIYYVVTVNEKEKKIVGVKVTAVES